MSWLQEDDNGGGDDNLPSFVRILNSAESAKPALSLDYWAVEPLDHPETDQASARRYFAEATTIAHAQRRPNIFECVLTSMIRKGQYRPIEASWLTLLASKARAAGYIDDLTESELDDIDRHAGRLVDRSLLKAGETEAICDLLTTTNPDAMMLKIHNAMTELGMEMRTGYLTTVCRAAYLGSRH